MKERNNLEEAQSLMGTFMDAATIIGIDVSLLWQAHNKIGGTISLLEAKALPYTCFNCGGKFDEDHFYVKESSCIDCIEDQDEAEEEL